MAGNAEQYELDELRFHWGGAYLILQLGPDVWVAQRRDNHATLRAESPDALRTRIREDSAAHPVSRTVPSQRLRPEG
jgi:hypothetical protein